MSEMECRWIARVRIVAREDRLEVRLRDGFARAELDVVKALYGRRWDERRRLWSVPHAAAALSELIAAWGVDRVLVARSGEEGDSVRMESREGAASERAAPVSRGAVGPGERPGQGTEADAETLLGRTRAALVLRGYSPKTRTVYLGHVRRFLEWCGGGSMVAPDDPEARGRAFLLELLRQRRISRSYHSQVVSALRFLCETVLGRRGVALELPRPRPQRSLPTVLSPPEVARMLAKT